jgi:hypothetical protein
VIHHSSIHLAFYTLPFHRFYLATPYIHRRLTETATGAGSITNSPPPFLTASYSGIGSSPTILCLGGFYIPPSTIQLQQNRDETHHAISRTRYRRSKSTQPHLEAWDECFRRREKHNAWRDQARGSSCSDDTKAL